jgi:alkylation response protein AidB-like acyl-CoA dehydrogenase
VDALRKAVALGFAGLYVRESEGGTGLGRLAAAILFEELAAAGD